MHQSVGLYLHIPFCASKCDYCDFYSLPAQSEEKINAYLKALNQHIVETAPSAEKYTVDSVYVGGGTPSVLGHKRLVELLDLIRHKYKVSKSAEITVEANPDSVQEKMLKKLRKAGYNRLSLGVQCLDNETLRALGRPHTAEQAGEAFLVARAAGFDNISVDLMYGLPGQSERDWLDTLDAALLWKPEHVSCYALKLEEKTPLYERRGTLAIPSDDTQADMYLSTVKRMELAGFIHYEISNFSLPSRQSRHNMKYWKMQPFLGLGAAASSDFHGRRWSNIRDLQGYIDRIWSGDSLVEENEKIPFEERAAEYIMLGLRTRDGISSNEYARLFRMNFEQLDQKMEAYARLGLAQSEGGHWRLTAAGFLVSNQIIGQILDDHRPMRPYIRA